MNPLFLAILAIAALSIIRGWSRGLLGLAYGVISWVFLVGFVAVANPILYNYFMQNEAIYAKVYDAVYPYADASVPKEMGTIRIEENEASADADDDDDDKDDGRDKKGGGSPGLRIDRNILEELDLPIPDAVKDLIPEEGVDLPPELSEKIEKGGAVKIPKELQGVVDALEEQGVDVYGALDEINGGLGEVGQKIRELAVKKAAEEGTRRAMKALALLVSYLSAKILCVVVGFLVKMIKDAPVIGKVERAGGAALGAVEACLYTWVILMVVALARPTPLGRELYGQAQENAILRVMYERDPFIAMVEDFK